MLQQQKIEYQTEPYLDVDEFISTVRRQHVIWIRDGERSWSDVAEALGCGDGPGCVLDARDLPPPMLVNELSIELLTAPFEQDVCVVVTGFGDATGLSPNPVVTAMGGQYANDPSAAVASWPMLWRLAAIARASESVDSFWIDDEIAELPGAVEGLTAVLRQPICVLPRMGSRDWSMRFPDPAGTGLTARRD